ncbi:MAG: FAD binding domain-containing protein [Acidobacteria bacterium]|nr:FAD binding domain-containing protein [Acidobacteriota bacterium]
MSLPELSLHGLERPDSLGSVCERLAERAARGEKTVLLAGGTDWFVERHVAPATDGSEAELVLDVSRLPELRGISASGDTLWIGAATTYLELRRHPVVAARVPLLPAMSKDVGAVQIQARGTLGGNLATASPAADGVGALAALDATVHLLSVRGPRSIAISDYFTGYKRSVRAADEVITGFTVQMPGEGSFQYWRKVGTRLAQAISKVALAGVAEVSDGQVTRLGLGMVSVAPTTAFLPTVRALALRRPLDRIADSALDAATQADVSPIDDVRSTGDYRRHVSGALVREFFRTLRSR